MNSLAAQTGLSANQVSSALAGIAPALLSGLSAATSSSGAAGKVDLSDGLDLGDVMAMLGGAQSGASPVSGLLGSLVGGSQSSASPMGGLLGSLLGGGIQESDNSLNGNALMSALLSAMK